LSKKERRGTSQYLTHLKINLIFPKCKKGKRRSEGGGEKRLGGKRKSVRFISERSPYTILMEERRSGEEKKVKMS